MTVSTENRLPANMEPTLAYSLYAVFRDLAREINRIGSQESSITLVDAATVLVDASAGNNFRLTLGGNRTLGNPTNLRSGQVLNFRFTQDGTGSRTLAYGSKYKFAGGAAPTLSTAAGTKDFMSCQYDEVDDTLVCAMTKAFA